jgi:DNA-binding NtrC family response regulator
MEMLMSNELKMLGKSPEISRVSKAIKAMAKRDERVLILGEVGSGRSFIAESIHRLGAKRDKPFLSIQCGAIGDTIDVETIFGDGTNGSHSESSYLATAKDGTIYFDGIDRLNSTNQDRLFNFLTTMDNSKDKKTKYDPRIIASTDPGLEEAVRNRQYRLDLFQWLNEFRINLPPLRERKQDIPFIFSYFLEEFCREFGKAIPTVPYDIFEAVLEYDWPGNVAELRNCVRNLVIMSPDGELSPEFLPFRVKRNPLEVLATRDLPSAVSEVERFLIRKALARFEGNQTKAARLLQVSEAALRYKMKKYGFPSAR